MIADVSSGEDASDSGSESQKLEEGTISTIPILPTEVDYRLFLYPPCS